MNLYMILNDESIYFRRVETTDQIKHNGEIMFFSPRYKNGTVWHQVNIIWSSGCEILHQLIDVDRW